MKFINKIIIVITGIVLLTVSCSKEMTLQEYFVKNQDNDQFILIDIPSSVIVLDENASEEARDALKSIRKFNLLAFKIDSLNKNEYFDEKQLVKKILSQDQFNELVRMKHDKVQIQVKYIGDDTSVDELIVFASEDSKGFLLARILGKEMTPGAMLKLAENIGTIDKDHPALAGLKQIFEQSGNE